MKTRKGRVFACDFETTVYKGQVNTEVWASAVVELNTDDVKLFHSLDDTFNYLKSLDSDIIIYYHNLKFDGSFWLSYLMCNLEYKQAVIHKSENETNVKFVYEKDMKNKTFKYSISDIDNIFEKLSIYSQMKEPTTIDGVEANFFTWVQPIISKLEEKKAEVENEKNNWIASTEKLKKTRIRGLVLNLVIAILCIILSIVCCFLSFQARSAHCQRRQSWRGLCLHS